MVARLRELGAKLGHRWLLVSYSFCTANHSLHGLRPIILCMASDQSFSAWPQTNHWTISSYPRKDNVIFLSSTSNLLSDSVIAKKNILFNLQKGISSVTLLPPTSKAFSSPSQKRPFLSTQIGSMSSQKGLLSLILKQPVISHRKGSCYPSYQKGLLSLIPKGPAILHPKRLCYLS